MSAEAYKVENKHSREETSFYFQPPINAAEVHHVTDLGLLSINDDSSTSSTQSDQAPELMAFAYDSDSVSSDDSSLSSDDEEESRFDSLDELLDHYSILAEIQGRPNKRQRTGPNPNDLRPVAFVRLNTSLGKPKPVTIKALLDSGGSESLVNQKFVKKLRQKRLQKSVTWSTPAGCMTMSEKV